MLTVSRPNIATDSITEFPAAERFIKLPIESYLDLLGVKDSTNRAQIALINAINDPRFRFVCAALARRIGKTYIANIIAQLISLVPVNNVLIISPNYNLSTISFELQRTLIKHFGIEVERDNLKDKVIELVNQSTVRMGSLATVDSTVGRSYKLILFDEAALSSSGRDAFNTQLRATLDTPDSKAIFISTPRGLKNWFAEFFQRGYSDEHPEWCSIHADYKENPRISEKDIEEAKRTLSKAEFEQEYLAKFTIFEGQIYNFDREKCIVEYTPKDRAEFIAGLDAGYKDPTAFAVIAYYVEDGVDYFHIVDEYLDTGTTDIHAAAMQGLIDKWGIELIFIDSAAAQFGADLTYTYDISVSKSNKKVLPGIAYLQSIVEQDRLRVAPHCQHSLAALDQYRWDNKDGLTREKPLHEYSDMADAIRYAIYTFTI